MKHQKATHVQTAYLQNSELQTLKENWPGNKLIDGMFANGDELYQPAFVNVLKWKLAENPQKKEKAADDYTPPVKPDPDFFSSAEDALVWLGHASFLLRLNNFTFIIDPVFFDLPMLKRRTPLPFPTSQLQNLNYLLLSHGHRDHFDEKSIKVLFRQNPGLKALIPLRLGKLLQKMAPGMAYQEAGWYQQYNLPADTGIEIIYLPASHWHRRGLTDMNQVLWGSFLIRTPQKSIYFAGDSGYKDHFTEIKRFFGEPDFCLMPIGAYKPAFIMEKSHLNPGEAVQAFNDLGGRFFIPMHFGTFDLSDEPAGEPIRLMQQYAAAGKMNGQLLQPAIGEALPI
ncbi:membrane protein [Adhaeribacter aerolatus]|uniref:Membrane protein n=1 Tax=Adhaeribacter aerolatus TaxID=670289 RepID=A0A512B3B8_9BACT|nr:MBL fold metallo-hydrolase [Adhaeribacter aerolatus]GEO06287.1 membrane protein [Adhaeribacter aerolatus]